MTAFYNRAGDYDVTQLEDEWIVLNTDQYTLTTLNEVGGYCWSLLSSQMSLDDLVQAVQAQFQFDASLHDVKADLETFLSELVDCGLVEYAEE